jgi:Domain of unknown function (DUF892)
VDVDELPEMDVLPEAIPSRSGGARTGRDVGRPSKSRSDRTSVRAVNPARAINVQTFFSCVGSPSAAPARHPGLSPNDAARRVSINTLQSWDVPADIGASTHRRASSNLTPEPQRRDTGLVAGAEAVEHYEMARYGALAGWATHLGMPEAAKLLNETLQEEMNAEKLLTRIAKSKADKTAATKIAA